jgi:pyruvate/2-oxoglutarate dehydrogenase complex dihydrolipoamide dehydrogenase (E3) component
LKFVAVAAAAARGVLPTLLGILPYAGLKFYVYQAMKNHYRATSSSRIDQPSSQVAQQQQQQQQQQQLVPAAHDSGSIGSSNVAVAQAADCSLALTAANTLLSNGNTPQQQQHAGHQQQQLPDDSQQQQEQQQQPQKLPVMATLVFGGLAGLVAQTVTYPLVSTWPAALPT